MFNNVERKKIQKKKEELRIEEKWEEVFLWRRRFLSHGRDDGPSLRNVNRCADTLC